MRHLREFMWMGSGPMVLAYEFWQVSPILLDPEIPNLPLHTLAQGSVSMPLTVSLSASGGIIFQGSVTLPLGLDLPATGVRICVGDVVLPLSIALDATGAYIAVGEADLPMALDLEATPVYLAIGAATLPMRFSLGADGSRVGSPRRGAPTLDRASFRLVLRDGRRRPI